MSLQEYTYLGGENRRIGVLLRLDHKRNVEAWGNRATGWCAYLVDGAGIALRISDRYDRLSDLKDAAWRAFQVNVKAPRGRFHDQGRG